MTQQSRETLPVAVTDIERRTQIAKEISDEIALSTYNLENLTDTSLAELESEFDIMQRQLGVLATKSTRLLLVE